MKPHRAASVLLLMAGSLAHAQDGGSCANAIPLLASPPQPIVVDTATGAGWINNYGPLVSPSNDIVYTFTTGPSASSATITATTADYAFAIYILSSCVAGAGPTPIAATSTLNSPIFLLSFSQPNTQYWMAVTGTAAGGAAANGTVSINITSPVTLQSFSID